MLNKPPAIEAVFDIREWLETVPLTVRGFEENIRRLLMVNVYLPFCDSLFL